MFDKLRYWLDTRKIFFALGSNPSKPTINDMIVASPMLVALSMSRKSSVFSNKYVCADAVIITSTYAAYLFEESGVQDDTIVDLLASTRFVIKDVLRIDPEEAKELIQNRFSYFNTLLIMNKGNDVKPILSEAQLLFAHDLLNDKFVKYSIKSPVAILGFDKLLEIQIDTQYFFSKAMPAVLELIDSYFESYLDQ